MSGIVVPGAPLEKSLRFCLGSLGDCTALAAQVMQHFLLLGLPASIAHVMQLYNG